MQDQESDWDIFLFCFILKIIFWSENQIINFLAQDAFLQSQDHIPHNL